MFIEDESFVKLVNNPKHYFNCEPEAITDCYGDPIDNNVRYPKIKIDDIELCCLHYKNCKEAIDKWNERKKRVNLDNIMVIANTWNLHSNMDVHYE